MTTPKVQVETVNDQVARSAGTAKSAIPQLVQSFPPTGHIISTFKHTLIGIGTICDAECNITFSNRDITVFDPDNTPVLTGWRETAGDKLWHFYLLPDASQLPLAHPDTENDLLSAYIAYELPSVKALVRYLHAAAVFPVKSTWLNATKSRNFATFPGFTYSNAAKYYHELSETIKAHIIKSRNNFPSNKPPKVTSPNMLMVA